MLDKITQPCYAFIANLHKPYIMSESGICTSCGATAELNEATKCPNCAAGSMESPSEAEPMAETATPAEEAA